MPPCTCASASTGFTRARSRRPRRAARDARAGLGVDFDDRDDSRTDVRRVEVDLRLQPGRSVPVCSTATARSATRPRTPACRDAEPTSSNTTMSTSAASRRSRRAGRGHTAVERRARRSRELERREPNVPTPCGTRSVSEATCVLERDPSTDDVICAQTVSWPCPFGTLPVTTVRSRRLRCGPTRTHPATAPST